MLQKLHLRRPQSFFTHSCPLIVQILNPGLHPDPRKAICVFQPLRKIMDPYHRLQHWPLHGDNFHLHWPFSAHLGLLLLTDVGLFTCHLSTGPQKFKGWRPQGACTGNWLYPEKPPGKHSKGRQYKVARRLKQATWLFKLKYGTIMRIFHRLC